MSRHDADDPGGPALDPTVLARLSAVDEVVAGGETTVVLGRDTYGRRAACKVHRRGVTMAVADAIAAVQSAVAGQTGLAPIPLAAPWLTSTGRVATMEAQVPRTPTVDVRLPVRRAAMAAALHRTVVAASQVPSPVIHVLRSRPDAALIAGTPYPVPHDPVFDFDATAVGAEWIDDLAWGALACRPTGGAVVHGDWRPENVMLDALGDQVVCAVDWDSVHVGDEAWVVGGVSRAFSTAWRERTDGIGVTHDPMMPSPADMWGFLHDYGHARGTPFDERERAAAHAGMIHALAYSARCEHALPRGMVTWPVTWQHLLRTVAKQSDTVRLLTR